MVSEGTLTITQCMYTYGNRGMDGQVLEDDESFHYLTNTLDYEAVVETAVSNSNYNTDEERERDSQTLDL